MTIEDHSFAVDVQPNGNGHQMNDEQNSTAYSHKSYTSPSSTSHVVDSIPSAQTNGENHKVVMKNEEDTDVDMLPAPKNGSYSNNQREIDRKSTESIRSSVVHLKQEQSEREPQIGSINASIQQANGISDSNAIETDNPDISPPSTLSSSAHQTSSDGSATIQAINPLGINNTSGGVGVGSNPSPNKLKSSNLNLNGTSPKRNRAPEPILSRNFAPLPLDRPLPSQKNGSMRAERKSKVSLLSLILS